MKLGLRFLSLILALIMLASVFVSCGDTGSNNDVGKNENNTNTETDKASLNDINWEGEPYRILGNENDNKGFHNFEIDYDELPEDVVGIAVWNRNEAIKAKYGLDVIGTLTRESTHEVAKIFLESGDDQYDLIICGNDKFLPMATQGYLANIPDLKYVDLEKDCWNDYVNEQMTFGGRLYYTSNKFLLQDKHRTWMIWYNRSLANELNIGHLENEVFEGTWTIDRVIEIAKIGSAEYDGQDGMTSADKWGFTADDPYVFAQLAYGCGFRMSNIGSDGYPRLIGATDQMLTILDKIFVLSSDTTTSFFSECRPTADENTPGKGGPIFQEGRAVLMGHCLSYLDNLDKLDFEYGALPNPKYTVDQESYYSVPNVSNGFMFAVPATVMDIDKAGFGLQAISEESVNTSYYTYIEQRCKLQDAYDEDMAKCLGIIFDGVVYDIAFVDNFGGLGEFMKIQLVKQGSNTYKRQYDKLYKKANNQIKQTKESYEKIALIG